MFFAFFTLVTVKAISLPETHNDRLVQVETDFWQSSGPMSLLQQGHVQQAAQDHVRMVSKYL